VASARPAESAFGKAVNHAVIAAIMAAAGRSSGGVAVNLPTQRLLRDEGAEGEELETYCGAKETDHYSSRCEGAAAFTEVRRKVGWMHEGVGPPNGSRLSCGAPKNDSFHNLRAPPASSAC